MNVFDFLEIIFRDINGLNKMNIFLKIFTQNIISELYENKKKDE